MELLRFAALRSTKPPRPANLKEVQAVSHALRRQIVGVRAVEEVAPRCAHERNPGCGRGGRVAQPPKPRVSPNAALARALRERSRRMAHRDRSLAVGDHGPRAEFAVEQLAPLDRMPVARVGASQRLGIRSVGARDACPDDELGVVREDIARTQACASSPLTRPRIRSQAASAGGGAPGLDGWGERSNSAASSVATSSGTPAPIHSARPSVEDAMVTP